jgi:1-acyl-sn-glycerol-3-phosphate acyltransferase
MSNEAERTAARRASSNGHTKVEDRSGNGAATRPGLAQLVGMLGQAVGQQVAKRIPSVDLDERDPDFIRENLPGSWLLASFYFRADVKGLHNIPSEGPVLMVGNHSGGNMTPDTIVFTLAFSTYFGVERRFHQLAHNLVLSAPGLGFLRKYGTVAAGQDNARKALQAGGAVLVYPGGDYEVHRPSWDGRKVDFDRRKGFIKLALQEDVPIVPIVSAGGQETALFLSRGERIAKLTRIDKLFRLKVLPISLALPWGLNIGDMAGHIPLPAKIQVRALPAIDVRKEFGDDPDLDEAYDHITGVMQAELDSLYAQRRLPVIG